MRYLYVGGAGTLLGQSTGGQTVLTFQPGEIDTQITGAWGTQYSYKGLMNLSIITSTNAMYGPFGSGTNIVGTFDVSGDQLFYVTGQTDSTGLLKVISFYFKDCN